MVQRGLAKNNVPESVQRLIIKDTSQCGIRDPDNSHNFIGKCSFVFPQMFRNTSNSNRDRALQIRRRDGGLGTFEEQAAQAADAAQQAQQAQQAAQTGGGRRLGRRLGRRRLHPLNAHVVPIPANVPLQTLKHPTSKHTRRLDGVSIPSDAFTTEGGSCSITTGDDFPKTITCNVELLIKPSTFLANQSHLPDISANVRAQGKEGKGRNGETWLLLYSLLVPSKTCKYMIATTVGTRLIYDFFVCSFCFLDLFMC